jgi:N utilization substance protein B
MTNPPLETITRNARIAAVQCSYAVVFLGRRPTARLLGYFLKKSFASEQDSDSGAPAVLDAKLFAYIVRGISREREAIDARLAGLLKVALDRNDQLLVALLRAGAFELMFRTNAPKAAVVAEYTKIAAAFYPKSKVALVNVVLDKIAKELPGVAKEG